MMTPKTDLGMGALVFTADQNWKHLTLFQRLRIRFCGDRQTLDHLGMRVHLSWWKAKPYLVAVSELDA